MVFIIVLILLILSVKIYFMFPVGTAFKLRSDHLTIFFGAPGTGKSTLAAYFAIRAQKAGYKVYSNVPIKGCYECTKDDYGRVKICDGLTIIDEAGLDWNNRDFATNFNKRSGGSAALSFFKKHRHEGCEVMMFSQTFDDMDKKLFDLADKYYLVSKGIFPFRPKNVVYRRIKVKVDINPRDDQIYDKYWFMPFGKRRIWCSPCWPYFDSFDRMDLPEKENWHIFGEPRQVDEYIESFDDLTPLLKK